MVVSEILVKNIVDRVIEMLEDGNYLYWASIYDLKKDIENKKFMDDQIKQLIEEYYLLEESSP